MGSMKIIYRTYIKRGVPYGKYLKYNFRVLIPKLLVGKAVNHNTNLFFLYEPYLDGLYLKFTDNNGSPLIVPHELEYYSDILSAFAHYTFSKGECVATDLQGTDQYLTDMNVYLYKLTQGTMLRQRNVYQYESCR